jgi:ribonuclease R
MIKEVEEILRRSKKGVMTVSQIARILGISKKKVKSSLSVLIREGKVIRYGRGYALIERIGKKLTGRLEVKRGGFGFVITDEGDVFVPSWALKDAEDGDIVEVVVLPKRGEGRVVRVVERARIFFVGKYLGRGKVEVEDSRAGIVDAKIKKGIKVKKGDIVLVKRSGKNWRIVEVRPDDYDIIIKTFNLPEEFPREVLEEAENLEYVEDERVDLTDEFTITIDPKTAKDYDDAIYVERYEKGWILKVHIADVSHWVKKGSHMDMEAFKRGNSVYLIEKVIPMLPHVLSDNLASLLPGQPKLTFTVEVKITRDGKILTNTARFYKSKIFSWARLTYEDAQRILDDSLPEDRETVIYKGALGAVKRVLREASNLAEVLRAKREEKGSIDFDLPEAEFLMDDGKVVMVSPKERLWTHKIIEELMITANTLVAQYFAKNKIPTLCKIHPNPKEKKIKEFIKLVEKLLGRSFKNRKITPKFLSDILKEFSGRPEENLINYLLLRSMARAVYSPKNVGHFGLALKDYLHFTSPIRRYADLVVHRQLWASLKGDKLPYTYKELENIGKHLSEMERLAEEAEWELWKLKICEFMEKKLGEEFEGIVTGISEEAIFVQITQHLAEGYIPIRSIKNYRVVPLPKEHSAMLFRKNKTERITLGDRVLVRVRSVDKYAKDITLEFLKTL